MATFECVVLLPVSPGEASAFVEQRGQEVEPLQFQPRSAHSVGVLNDLTGRVLGVPIRGVSRTLVWDPPSRCVFESVKPSWPVRTRITELFAENGDGTRHVIYYEVIPRGPIGYVAAPLLCWAMKRSRVRYQERLKHVLTS